MRHSARASKLNPGGNQYAALNERNRKRAKGVLQAMIDAIRAGG
jgi:hypothetical protein